MLQHGSRDASHLAIRLSVAFIWLSTGLGVLHPTYRVLGEAYLGRLGLPPGVMVATCVAEVLFGLYLCARPAGPWASWGQVGAILGFTAILGWLEPMLLVHPLGVLSKNLPLIALIVVNLRLERDDWNATTEWLLRAGMAVIWLTEGLFPKIVFQQAWELDLAARMGFGNPSLVLTLLGVAQACSAAVVLVARGRLLRFVLGTQVAALVVLPIMVTIDDPSWWVHPFGALTKTVPILVGTLVVLRRCYSKS